MTAYKEHLAVMGSVLYKGHIITYYGRHNGYGIETVDAEGRRDFVLGDDQSPRLFLTEASAKRFINQTLAKEGEN